MNTGSEALLFFYAVFWSVAVSGANRFIPFNTAAFWLPDQRRRSMLRALVSFFFLTVFPVLWLLFLHMKIVPRSAGLPQVISAVLASLSVFGFIRLLHAFIASDATFRHFYTADEVEQVRCLGKFGQSQLMRAHLVPGLAYLGLFVVLAFVVRVLWDP